MRDTELRGEQAEVVSILSQARNPWLPHIPKPSWSPCGKPMRCSAPTCRVTRNASSTRGELVFKSLLTDLSKAVDDGDVPEVQRVISRLRYLIAYLVAFGSEAIHTIASGTGSTEAAVLATLQQGLRAKLAWAIQDLEAD